MEDTLRLMVWGWRIDLNGTTDRLREGVLKESKRVGGYPQLPIGRPARLTAGHRVLYVCGVEHADAGAVQLQDQVALGVHVDDADAGPRRRGESIGEMAWAIWTEDFMRRGTADER